ncbi:MAG: hypothetical protein FWG74_06350 [Planctomycetes bacterium]|nr:hypothetical protein [Planctomycetota bacterium]
MDSTPRQGRFASLELKPARQSADQPGDKGWEAPLRDAFFYMNEGLQAELAGDHEKALNKYSTALGENPLHIEAWTAQIWMLLYLKEPIEAQFWADRALESFPNHPDLLALKSLSLARCGLTNKAWELNDAALKGSRESVNVWLARGELRIAAKWVAAEACFRRALAISSERYLTAMRCGDICLLHNCHAEAEGYFQEALPGHTSSAWIWYGLGLSRRALGWKTPARAAFARAVRLVPTDWRYRKSLEQEMELGERFKVWLNRAFR